MCLDLKDSMADVTFTHPGIYAISESFLDDLQIKSHHSFFRQHNANPPLRTCNHANYHQIELELTLLFSRNLIQRTPTDLMIQYVNHYIEQFPFLSITS